MNSNNHLFLRGDCIDTIIASSMALVKRVLAESTVQIYRIMVQNNFPSEVFAVYFDPSISKTNSEVGKSSICPNQDLGSQNSN